MTCSKRRKVNEENVYFFGTEKFIFILVVSISMPHIPHICHYETKHTFFEQLSYEVQAVQAYIYSIAMSKITSTKGIVDFGAT